MIARGTGFLDSSNPKDIHYGIHDILGSPPVKSSTWLQEYIKAGKDQWDTQSCTAFGIAQVFWINQGSFGIPEADRLYASELAIYYIARAREWGAHNIWDSGSSIHDAMEGIRTHGVIEEKYLPFDPTKRNDPVSGGLFRKASDEDYFTYRWILDPPGSRKRRIQQTLSTGRSLTMAVVVDQSFKQWQLSHGAWKRHGDPEGSHLIVIFGYDDAGVWCVNSYGADFGEGGLILVSWEYVESEEARGFTTTELNLAKFYMR